MRSSAFYMGAFTYEEHRDPQEAGRWAEATLNTRAGMVEIYAERPAGQPQRAVTMLNMTLQGRNYSLTFEEYLSEATIKRRARVFAVQVPLMAAHEVKALPFGAPVPAPAVVASVPAEERRQLPLFDAGTISRAEHFDEVQQILEAMLSKAKAGCSMVAPLSYALAANDSLRVQYGIMVPVATITAGKS